MAKPTPATKALGALDLFAMDRTAAARQKRTLAARKPAKVNPKRRAIK